MPYETETDLEKIGETEVFVMDHWEKRPEYKVPDWASGLPEDWSKTTTRLSEKDSFYDEETEELLSNYQDKTILDLGSKYYTYVAAVAGSENNVIQLDNNREALNLIEKQKEIYLEEYGLEIQSETVQADAGNLPFDRSIDVVYAGGALDDNFRDGDNLVHFEETNIPDSLKNGGDFIVSQTYLQTIDSIEEALERMDLTDFAQSFKDVRLTESSIIFKNYKN